MISISFRSYLLALALSFSILIPLNAQTANSNQQQQQRTEVDTTMRGVKLQIIKFIRLDATHLLVALNVMMGTDGPNPVFIGEPAPGGLPPANAPPSVANSEKYRAKPYSLAFSKLFDESTKQQFDADQNVPDNPYLGPNVMITTLNHNCGVQLAVLFPVPPPQPPNSDGKIPPQKVTFLFTKAKRAMEHVEIPLPDATVSGTGSPTASAR